MSKVSDFLSQQLPITSVNLGGANPLQTGSADKNLGVQPAPDDEPGGNHANNQKTQTPATQRQELQSRMPITGQLLKHSLNATVSAQVSAKAATQNPGQTAASIHISAQAGANATVAQPKTALQAVHQGLMKHAENAGLPLKEQTDFANKFTNKFVGEAKAKGQEKLLEKTGDFSLLANNRTVAGAKVAGNLTVRLGAEASADLQSHQAKLGVAVKTGGEVVFKLGQNTGGDPNAKPGQNGVSQNKFNPALNQNLNAQPNSRANVAAQMGSLSASIANNTLQNLQQVSRRDAAQLRDAVMNKVGDVLRQIGVDVPELRNAGRGEFGVKEKLPEELRETAQLLKGGNLESKDDAMFASALGIASDSAEESRNVHGDGLLLEFANYADEKTADKIGGKEFSFESTVQKLLETGSQAGIESLLVAAENDLTDTALDGLAQIAADSSADSMSDLVVGVLTMSVMTREVVERLDHIASGGDMGLSDDAMAALQKAQNNLRDHLTATDLVGAAGDVKGTPISVNGSNYNFLPEVSEALNSLREARHRILSETSSGGMESFARFTVEADALFKITSGIERMLKI